MKIDRNMRELIAVLNEFPGIRTYASCGGHLKLEGRITPVKKGSFYVNFATPLDDKNGDVVKSISIIEKVIERYGKDVILEKTIFPDKEEHRFWSLDGKKVSPKILAYQLYRELRKNQMETTPP